jgi:hypothetical protein
MTGPSFPEGGFVAFVTAVDAPKQVNADKPSTSNLASTRLRVLIPARQLARRVPVWLVSLEELLRRPDLAHLGRAGSATWKAGSRPRSSGASGPRPSAYRPRV